MAVGDDDGMTNERTFGARTMRVRMPSLFAEDYLATIEQQLAWEDWHQPRSG
jgi:hypothetical protein